MREKFLRSDDTTGPAWSLVSLAAALDGDALSGFVTDGLSLEDDSRRCHGRRRLLDYSNALLRARVI
jgi:hypothetical protein